MLPEDWRLPYDYDTKMETRKWLKEIPELQFPEDWKIKIVPPFAGATVRFMISKGEANVSIYLDCYDNLGCVGQPYWEVYPYNGDVYRCYMNETEILMKAIHESIREQS